MRSRIYTCASAFIGEWPLFNRKDSSIRFRVKLESNMKRLVDYLGSLRGGKIALWCYLLWYLAMAAFYFDPRPSLWLNSVGISVVIGTALVLSVIPPAGLKAMEKWAVARLYMMPFFVSSFGALIKDRGFVAVFSPSLRDNLIAIGACALFVACAYLARELRPRAAS